MLLVAARLKGPVEAEKQEQKQEKVAGMVTRRLN